MLLSGLGCSETEGGGRGAGAGGDGLYQSPKYDPCPALTPRFLVIILMLLLTPPSSHGSITGLRFHAAQFDVLDNFILVKFNNEGQTEIQRAELGKGIIPNGSPQVQQNSGKLTLSWSQFGSLDIHYIEHESGDEYKVEWKTFSKEGKLQDSYQMSGTHWYGVGQIRRQEWPIEKWVRSEKPFVTGDSFVDDYGGVQDRYWLSSKGFAVYVHHDIPLFISMNNQNDGKLILISKWESPYSNLDNENVQLSYRLFISSDMKRAHELATKEVFSKPVDIPDVLIFKYPIWSTWARYKKDIKQDLVIGFAKEIKEHCYKASQIEIDDDWTKRYGDMEFDSYKFPDPGKMVQELEKLGFRMTIWVHPFCSPHSDAARHSYWMTHDFIPTFVKWWNGVGKIMDVTKPQAVSWFKKSLSDLKTKYKLTSFKFDAGEVNWLPPHATPWTPWKNPNTYTTLYAELAYDSDKETRAQEVRVGLQTQHLPIFVRMMDKDSNWGYDNGLKTLIPHALTFSILGYPFILPDMIGGNAYSDSGVIGSSSPLPDRELYIRWLQANVFLPALQFSISPWQYDEELVRICRNLTKLHEKYADTFIELAKESVQSGAPIIRPLWWIAPNDETAQVVDDEFLLGDDILVAPVLEKGAVSRNIYLPDGTWYDTLRDMNLQGGKWYNNYQADLHELPYFTKNKMAWDKLNEEDMDSEQNVTCSDEANRGVSNTYFSHSPLPFIAFICLSIIWLKASFYGA